MLSPIILVPAILNGLLTGAVYALVALGLTLIYGVLHIINFAHGALLTAAMFAAFFAHREPALRLQRGRGRARLPQRTARDRLLRRHRRRARAVFADAFHRH